MTISTDLPTRTLSLARPLVSVDLETTSADKDTARIVELALVKLEPDGTVVTLSRRLNPGVPISPDATAVHGIRNEDVTSCPPFADVVQEALAFIGEADFTGFGCHHFDLPILLRELRQAGASLDMTGRAIVDTKRIYHLHFPRDLSTAVREYTGREHADAHQALGDAHASLAVLAAQLERHADLPTAPHALAEALGDPPAIDSGGCVGRADGQLILVFSGKHHGRSLEDLARTDPGYLDWLLRAEFPADTKALLRQARDAARDPSWIDPAGKFAWQNGEAVLTFGRHKGRPIRDVARTDASFFEWMLRSDFAAETKQVARDALDGRFPLALRLGDPLR